MVYESQKLLGHEREGGGLVGRQSDALYFSCDESLKIIWMCKEAHTYVSMYANTSIRHEKITTCS